MPRPSIHDKAMTGAQRQALVRKRRASMSKMDAAREKATNAGIRIPRPYTPDEAEDVGILLAKIRDVMEEAQRLNEILRDRLEVMDPKERGIYEAALDASGTRLDLPPF